MRPDGSAVALGLGQQLGHAPDQALAVAGQHQRHENRLELKMPLSVAVIWPLIQSRKMELTAMVAKTPAEL